MENLPFILVIVLAACVYAAYFYTERRLVEEKARTTILREREAMAARLLFGYCRKLLLEESTYTNKDEMLLHLSNVMQIYGTNLPSATISAAPAAAHEPSSATCGEEGGGGEVLFFRSAEQPTALGIRDKVLFIYWKKVSDGCRRTPKEV